MITWSSDEFLMFSSAFPEKRPWVAKDDTVNAPFSFKILVA